MMLRRWIIPVLIGWYLVLCAGHYLSQRPLWNDEQCVLNNITELTSTQIFSRQLLNDQDFPRLYLCTIQRLSQPFHQHLLALRLFPLAAMLAAFFCWFYLSRRVLTSWIDQAMWIACWCASIPLIYYAAELKPYSMDVLAAGLITLFLMGQEKLRQRGLYLLIVFLLPFLSLWSYAAIFLLLLPLYDLIRQSVDERRWKMSLAVYLAGCLLALGFVYCVDFHTNTSHLWEETWHEYFISFDSWKDFFNSVGKGMNSLVGRCFAENPRWIKMPSRIFISIGVLYMLANFGRELKKHLFLLRSLVAIAGAMFFLQLILAMLRAFPFAVPRMSLFFTPLLMLMTVLGVSALAQKNRAAGTILRILLLIYLIFTSFGIAWDIFINKNLGAESTLYTKNLSSPSLSAP